MEPPASIASAAGVAAAPLTPAESGNLPHLPAKALLKALRCYMQNHFERKISEGDEGQL